ncbi:MAG: ABC transporter substrate-binding protein [Myxococcales bacterium]|nr:ABC transporter substrate-binding protein [Myxococcales bacterium]
MIVLSAIVAACPGRGKRKVGAPIMTLPADGDSKARALFESSRSQFERDGSSATAESFEAIVRDFPNDPIVPHALLYGAIADMRHGNAAGALAKLDELATLGPTEATLQARASLFRGLALSSLGRHGEALVALTAGQKALNQGDSNGVAFWHAGMAEALAAHRSVGSAIVHYDAWWAGARASEKTYCLDRIRALSSEVPSTQLEDIVGKLAPKAGPGAAILGARWAEELAVAGNIEAAASVLVSISAAQRAVGEDVAILGSGGPGNVERIAALLPLSGRLNRVGELSLRGLVMASQNAPVMAPGTGEFSAFELISRDTSSDAAMVASGIESIVRNDAIAAIGPFDGSAVAKVSPLAASVGLPVISLAPRGSAGGAVFSIRHSAESRARRLAKHAYAQGIRDFAIFSPQSAYGRVVGTAFQNQVESLGGSIIVQATYAQGATSFTKEIKQLKKPWSALFIPDQAKTLALIAPALAAANLNAQPAGKKSKHGRSIMLLSTAEGIDRRYLRAAGRYSWGAVFAPGFFPDRTDPRIADFVARYEAEFGSEPSAHEAYAYDAAAVLRVAIDGGARTRQQLGKALRMQQVSSLTGEISFGPDNRRSDSGLLFEMQQPLGGQFELKALR